jgi:porin
MRTSVVLISLICNLAVSAVFAQSTVTATDLQHHRWVLQSINGEALPATEGKGKVPELDFGEAMHVTGNLGCNQFNGQAVLRDGAFLIEAMVSTRMMCPPPWGDIELTVQTLLGSESAISLDAAKKLTLAAADTTLVFRLEDWVAAANRSQEQSPEEPRGFHARGSRTGYTTEPPPFGGRNSPAGEVDEADVEIDPAFRFPSIDAAFEPWNEWKRRQNSENGLQLSAHYSTMYQGVSDSLTEDDKASAGVLRATARWTLVGKDTPNHGSLNIMLDHRHGFRDETPAGNTASQAGYIGVTSLFYNDQGFSVINLNWQQAFNDGNTGLIVGRYDPNDYMNVLGYVNPWSIFSNLAVNLDTSIALPDSSWGIGAGHWLNDQVYVLGGINDANGFGSDDLEFFEGGSEFFTFAHIGWTPSKDERYFKNVHVMAWHVDEREDLGIESANGVALAANWTFDDKWMPFARLGFSKGSAPIYNESFTLGIIRKLLYRSDLVGIAANHGSPPDDSLRDQTSIEAFWRFQFSENLAITPSLQLLKDPALNPVDDIVWVFGVRARLTF